MAAIRRVHSSGVAPPASLIHRGTFIALGAVGISLGAVYAWTRTKRPALEAPSSVLVAKKKSSRERRSRGKRHKSRAQPLTSGEGGGMHESSEEDAPAAAEDASELAAEHVAGEHSPTSAASEQCKEVEPMQPPELELAAAATRTADDALRSVAAPFADGDSTTSAGLTSSVASIEPSGETASDGWIPVERKQRKGRRAAAAAAEAVTGVSLSPEDTKDVLQPEEDEQPVEPAIVKAGAQPVDVDVVASDEPLLTPEPSPHASEEARRLRREAKKKRKAEQAAAKAESAVARARDAPAVKDAPQKCFAPSRSSRVEEVDAKDEASAAVHTQPSSSGAGDGSTVNEAMCADEQVAVELDAAERHAEAAVVAHTADFKAPVEWVEVKKRGGRSKK